MKHHFTRTHLYIFAGLYLAFAALTLFTLTRQTPSDWRENWNTASTLGTISGPFSGAIARQLQSCCLQFSLPLLPCCAGFLVGGIAFQFIPHPWPSIERPLRFTIWSLGLLGWLGG